MGIIKRQGLKGSIINYVGVALGAIFFLVIFPNILDKEYLGFYQLVLSLTLVFAFIPLVGTSNVLYRFYDKWKENSKTEEFNAFAFRLILLSGIVFTILWFLFKPQIVAFYDGRSKLFIKYFFIIPPLVIIQAGANYLDYYAMMKHRVAMPTFIREIVTRSLLIIVFTLLALEIVPEQYFVAMYVSIYILSFGMLFTYAYRYLNFRFGNAKDFRKNNSDLKEQFNYGANSAGMAFVGTLQNFADAIILPTFLGLGALGIYGRPLILGQMINIPFRSISNIASPIIMEAWNRNDLKKIEELNKKLSINLLIIGLFLFCLIVVNADNFFDLIKPEYRTARNVLFIIAFGRLFDMSFGLNSEILFSSKYYRWIVYFTVGSLILTIGLNYALIPILKMDGAALAVTISLILFNIAKNLFIWTKFKIHCFTKEYIPLILFGIVSIGVSSFIPYIRDFFDNHFMNVGLNILIRTSSAAILFIAPVLYFKISKDVNSFAQLILSGKIFKGGYKMEEL